MTTFTVLPLPPSALERIRARGVDDFGNPFEVIINQDAGGTPLRCCLRDAAVGERVALIAWQPADKGGPYAEVGPIFVHVERCAGYPAKTVYPEGFRQRRQLFRAYDPDGRQVHSQIVEAGDADAAIDDLHDRPDVEVIHSRNVLAGGYMFAIQRG